MGESPSKPVHVPTPLSQGLKSSKILSLAGAHGKPSSMSDRLCQDACEERLFDYHSKIDILLPSCSGSDVSTCDSEVEQSPVSTPTSSSRSLCQQKRFPVRLHVYDLGRNTIGSLTKLQNSISKEYGFFHTAVEVYSVEWSFGSFSGHRTGVLHRLPKMDAAHSYRETIEMGSTTLSSQEVGSIIGRLSKQWQGDAYDLFTRNCNHFSETFLKELGADPLPSWCNALAGKSLGLSDFLQRMDSDLDAGDAIWDFLGVPGADRVSKRHSCS